MSGELNGRRLAGAAVLAACLAVVPWPGHAKEDTTPTAAMFPPDVGWDPEFLLKYREPPLWTDGALARHRSRLRLSVEGINRLRVIIRIDERRSGVFEGTYLAQWKGDRRTYVKEHRTFRVSRADMERFLAETTDAGILVEPRQAWSVADDGNAICIDGEDLLIERVDAGGYRAAAANTACGKPTEFMRVARRIVELADADDALVLVQ